MEYQCIIVAGMMYGITYLHRMLVSGAIRMLSVGYQRSWNDLKHHLHLCDRWCQQRVM